MEPTREVGDDRRMWGVRPLTVFPGKISLAPSGAWSVVERSGDIIDIIESGDAGCSYEVCSVVVTAEEWNAMPEFVGW